MSTFIPGSQPGAAFNSGGGEMPSLVRAMDWSRTPLGPAERWPQSLRVAVGICLASRFPMFVWWGPELITIYNDAYIPVLGKRHPDALGRRAQEIWGEIWPVVGPQADAVMQRGEATWNERVLLVMERHGYPEETYFTWSYSPIPDESGGIGGVFCACTEETAHVLAERERDRLEAALRESGERYRAFIQLSSEGIWRFELDEPIGTDLPEERQVELILERGYLAECNDAMARMYGYTHAAEIAGWRLHQFHDAQDPRSREFLGAFVANGYRLSDAESRETGRDGEERIFLNSFVGEVREGRLVRAWGMQRDVTERRRAREAQRDSERRLRALIEQSSAGVGVLAPDGRFLFANQRLGDLVGYSREELLSMRMQDITHPGDVARNVELVERAAASGEDYNLEKRYIRKDGSIVWASVTSRVLRNEQGAVESVLGIVIDITARKRAEEERERLMRELEAQSAQLFEVFQRSPSFMAVVRGPQHVFELANERYYQLVGHRELIGKSAAEALPEIRGQGFFELLDRVYATGEAVARQDVRVALQRQPGQPLEERYVEFVYQAMRDAGGTITGIFAHGVDLTERHQAEEALRQSEAAFRQLADSMPQIVFAARPDGHVDYFNRQWYEYTGLPEGTVGFENWRHVHTEEGLKRVAEVWPEAVRTGQPYEIEYRLRRHDGEYRWHLGRARPIRDASGNIIRWFGTNTDIHDHKRLQEFNEELLQSERAARIEAERASESKSEFLATLSHELRTPLTPVLLTVSLMESHPKLPGELREDVATIRRNVELESRLISDLLDLTRITRGKLQLDMQEVDLHLILRSAIDICQREASARMVVDLGAARCTVRGDSTRLQQIFWNLINNAQKFTGPEGTITVRSSVIPGERIRVEVSDTGAGIGPEVLPRLFNAFEQGEVRVMRQQAGLGLGLAISRKLAEAHGGTITAASAGRGKGAVFTVELPLVGTPSPISAPPRPAAPHRPGRLLSVLLIEDHEATLKVLTKLLRGLGHRVTGASTAAAARAAARQDAFDLIISDLGLPDGSGLDLMRELRDRYGGRAIALTGYGMDSDVAASQDAGFAEHLTKPVDLSDLERAIQRVVARARLA